MDGYSETAIIKVIGIGGGGGNAVAHMVRAGIDGVDFICANTDAQALKNAKVKTGLQIGCNITKGLGAGANPAIFALTVALATSNSFLIPTHQVNALIKGPGGYRVPDFMRAGLIMSVLFIVVMLLMLNLVI